MSPAACPCAFVVGPRFAFTSASAPPAPSHLRTPPPTHTPRAVRFSREMRKRFIASQKYKTPLDWLKFFRGFQLGYLAPEAPAIAEFSTGEVMGHSSDRLVRQGRAGRGEPPGPSPRRTPPSSQAARFGVSRASQDAFALASHHKAAKATAGGLLLPEITPVDGITADNGVRGDATAEKLSSLKPAFVKPHGTHTVRGEGG